MSLTCQRAKKTDSDNQRERFIEAARELGCDEDEAAFKERLKKLTSAPPPNMRWRISESSVSELLVTSERRPAGLGGLPGWSRTLDLAIGPIRGAHRAGVIQRSPAIQR